MSHIYLSAKKKSSLLFFLLCASYFIGYLMRYDYGASLSEIITSEGITKVQAGLISTALFITYAVGQLVSGALGDKIKPYSLVLGGLTVSSVCNILMPFASGFGWMIALWAINGFAQAMLWPPMIRIMAENFEPPLYKKRLMRISFVCAFATILIYLLASLCIKISGWQLLFYLTGGSGVIIAVCDWLLLPKISVCPQKSEADTEKSKTGGSRNLLHLFGISGAFFIMFAILCHGAIKDGVTTWVPKMLSELFDVDNVNSILATVVLPILTMISLKINEALNDRFFKNEVKCAAFLFTVAIACFVMLVIFGKYNMVLTLILSGISVACIHGVNFMLIMRVPGYFGKYGRISTASGILNTFTYAGSAASTYTFGLLVDLWGWDTLIYIWIAIAVLGLVSCFLALKRWTSFSAE